jgi:hypothetical protein
MLEFEEVTEEEAGRIIVKGATQEEVLPESVKPQVELGRRRTHSRSRHMRIRGISIQEASSNDGQAESAVILNVVEAHDQEKSGDEAVQEPGSSERRRRRRMRSRRMRRT